jgi:type VI protein secretion system component Hcp|eukprot:scaffold349_cov267-Chaetoceros_neogracile.AAC.2
MMNSVEMVLRCKYPQQAVDQTGEVEIVFTTVHYKHEISAKNSMTKWPKFAQNHLPNNAYRTSIGIQIL